MFLTKNKITMSSSAICPKFSQNAWRKDLCSNCFKSKEDHKLSNSKNLKTDTNTAIMSKINANLTSSSLTSNTTTTTTSSTIKTNNNNNNNSTIMTNNKIKKEPIKSIMKYGIPNKDNKNKMTTTTTTTSTILSTTTGTKKSNRVSFPKDVAHVIGYGGDWSDCDNSDDDNDDFTTNNNNDNNHHQNDDSAVSDEEDLELKRITKSNTDFNMNNGNLLGDATDNIKKSFAALRLGAPLLDSEGKKQTLKISVQPFGSTTKTTSIKEKFELNKMEYEKVGKEKKTTTTTTTTTSSVSLVANKLESNYKKDNNKELNNNNNKKTITTTTTTTSQQSSIINNIKDSLETAVVAQIDSDGTNSPPVERAMEKSLLEEISETLEQKKLQQEQKIKP